MVQSTGYCFSCGVELRGDAAASALPTCRACAARHDPKKAVSFRVRFDGGSVEGPVGEERVNDLIQKGLAGPHDSVSEGDGPWVRLDQHALFTGCFVPGDPRSEGLKQQRSQTKKARSERRTREVVGRGSKIVVAVGVVALALAGALKFDEWVPESWVTGARDLSSDAMEAGSRKLRYATEGEDAVLEDMAAERGLPGQDVVQRLKREWPDASGTADARVEMGWTGLLQGTEKGLQQARGELEVAVALEPQNVSAVSALAVVYSAGEATGESMHNDSIALFNRATELAPDDVAVLRARAGMATVSSAWLDAEERSRDCLAAHPDDGICWWYLGQALSRMSRYAEAEQALAKARPLLNDAPVVNLALGSAALEAGRYSEVGPPLQEFLETYPNDPGIHALLARYYEETDQVSKAIEHGRTALTLGPDDEAPIRLRLAWLLFTSGGSATEALTVITPVADEPTQLFKREDRVFALLVACRSALAANKLSDAERYGRALTDMEPGWGPGELALALALQQQGLEADAGEVLGMADQTSVQGADAARFHLNSGRLYAAMGRETAVRIEFEQAVDSDGDWALAALALSGSFLQLNNPAAAIESVQRTWSLDIGRHDARSGLETLPVEPLDYDALERGFRAIQPVEFQSQIPTVVGIVQAHACVAEGIKCDKARATLRAVVDGDSGELYAHVWLARVELARGNPQAAVKLLDPALGQTDRQPFVMGLRGTAYAAMGDAERARVDFENGLRQLGDRTGLRVHYAQALLDLGDLDGAREQALLVLEQEPDVRARAVLVAVGEAAE